MAELDDLIEFVPEDKREAFKAKGAGYVRLTDDLAFEHVNKSQSLRDKVSRPVAEAALRNYETEKLPLKLKEEADKVRAEFKPKDETPEQKELREMREWKKQVEEREKADTRKAELRKKAAELKYDPLKAEKLYALPDADSVLDDLVKDLAERDKKIAELETKMKYGDKAPPGGEAAGANVISEEAFNKMTPREQAAHMAKPGAGIK